MLQLTWRAALMLGVASCGAVPLRDFYTPEERASVTPPMQVMDAGVVDVDAGQGVEVERGVERLSKPCSGVVSPMPLTGVAYRCINRTDGFVGYERVADETCDDVAPALAGRQVLAPRSDAVCQLTRGQPTKVVRLTDSSALLYFRPTSSGGVLIVEP